MTLRFSVLCLVAVFIAVLLAIKNYDTWTTSIEVLPEKVVSKKSTPRPESGQPPAGQKDQKAEPSIASYIFIAEKNPFHPDRKEYPIRTAALPPVPEVKKPPLVRPQVTLYGVAIAGDYRSASISYPGRVLQKGERDVVTLKIGDRVGDYKVAKISEDRIALEAQEDSFEVLLYDAKTPKRRVLARTENKPAAVTSTVPAPPEPPKPGGRPIAPGTPAPPAPAQPAVVQAPRPIPVSPAAVPIPVSPRTRRWSGPRTPGQ